MADEQVGIGGSHTGAHGCSLDLKEMLGVDGEVVSRNKLCELDEELSVWLGMGRALVQEMFQSRGAMGMRDVGV